MAPAGDTELSPAPDVIVDLAESCVRFVETAVGVRLDYTQDTLPVLDHYLRTAEGSREEVLGLVVPAAGAYFGEVVRRHIPGAAWETASGDYAAFRMVIPPGPIRMNPIGLAFEAATARPVADFGADLEMPERDRAAVHDAVARMGEVRESDFYTLSVRLEVLEQVHATLLGRVKNRS
jgi:hypothetical protein